MKQLFLLFILLITVNHLSAQIVGTVTDSKGQPLPYVNIYLDNTYKGTTSNEEGNYTLDITEKGDYNIIFQFLGFTTVKKEVDISSFPRELFYPTGFLLPMPMPCYQPTISVSILRAAWTAVRATPVATRKRNRSSPSSDRAIR